MTKVQLLETLQKSHTCSYYFYLLELTAAIASDYEKEANELQSLPLNAWIRCLSAHTNSEQLKGFEYVLKQFLATARWDICLITNLVQKDAKLIKTKKRLHELGLLTKTLPPDTKSNCLHDAALDIPLYFGPDRDISFGHYTLILQVIRASLLVSPDRKFTFFRAPLATAAFPQFTDIVRANFIFSVDLERDSISAFQLTSYFLQGNSERCREYWNKKLFSSYAIQSDNAYDNTLPLERQNRKLILYANNIIHRPLHLGDGRLKFENIEIARFIEKSRSVGRKLVCFSPRDSVYSGPGQQFRDTDINSYYEVFSWLITQGYSVMRVNPSGIPAEFVNEHFSDNSVVGMSVYDQMKTLALCEFAIGSSTGSTEYAHQLFGKPTLYIDSPIIFNTGTEAYTLHAAKIIIITDRRLLMECDIERLGFFLFGSGWSPSEAMQYGLQIQSLSSREKLRAVKSFAFLDFREETIDPFINMPNTISLQCLLGSKKKYPRMCLDFYTYENIFKIIEARVGS